jgi:hypothetical protein
MPEISESYLDVPVLDPRLEGHLNSLQTEARSPSQRDFASEEPF